jgi:hypothetical protein
MSKFIIVCAARTGSQMLTGVLAQHPDLQAPTYNGEIFCISRAGVCYPDIFDFTLPDNDFFGSDYWKQRALPEHIDSAFQKCDFIKLLYYHLNESVLDCLKDYTLVHLKRKNRLARFCSARIAEERIGSAKHPYKCNYTYTGGKIEIDPIIFRNSAKWHEKQENKIDSMSPLNIFYEDRLEDNVDKILRYTSLPKFDYKVSTKKIVNTKMCDLIKNYDEVKEYDLV